MRLIDADELKRKLEDLVFYRGNIVIEINDALHKVDECQTVDAEPVKHAHVVWTIKNSSYQTQCCSNCHRTFISRPDETIQFCPHCGAKMEDYPESGEGDNHNSN